MTTRPDDETLWGRQGSSPATTGLDEAAGAVRAGAPSERLEDTVPLAEVTLLTAAEDGEARGGDRSQGVGLTDADSGDHSGHPPVPTFSAEAITAEDGATLVTAEAGATPAADSDAEADDPIAWDLRLARLHLRTGLIGSALVALETLDTRGQLDQAGFADLAEARWRSGDLMGAAEAAEAHVDLEGRSIVAFVILVERLAAEGRILEARRLAGDLLRRDPTGVEQVLTGQPRSAAWPSLEEPSSLPWHAASEEVEPRGPEEAAGPLAGHTTAPRPERFPPVAAVLPPRSPSVPAASDVLDEVEAAIDAGAIEPAAVRLSLLLRTQPRLTPGIIALADRALARAAIPADVAALHLLRGDGYRLLGREREATVCYGLADAALAAALAPAAAPDDPRDPDPDHHPSQERT